MENSADITVIGIYEITIDKEVFGIIIRVSSVFEFKDLFKFLTEFRIRSYDLTNENIVLDRGNRCEDSQYKSDNSHGFAFSILFS